MRDWSQVSVLIVVLNCFIAHAFNAEYDSRIIHSKTNGKQFRRDSPPHIRPKRQVPTPINPEREKLLRDALSWLTLRLDGTPLTTSQLEPFYDVIKRKYLNSRFYRTLVSAFQHGVLPKLTLKENDKCDPTFMKAYREIYNNTFTYHFQKKFIFDNYYQMKKGPKTLPSAYCDYRQGLICNPSSSKCECPVKSKMESVQTSPPTQRCAIENDVECSLADLSHDEKSDHTELENNIHGLIFNLEKPVSCTSGTICRMGANDRGIFRCYDASIEKWKDSSRLPYMNQCTLGVYATPGMCEPPYVCYDYGLRAKPELNNLIVASRAGFCTTMYGTTAPIKIRTSNWDGILYDVQPLLLTFVNPRTIPLRGDKFVTYQREVQNISDRRLKEAWTISGTSCSITKNEQLEEIWKFYESLDNDPSGGGEFVATEDELNTKLVKLRNIFVGDQGSNGYCKIYWVYREFEDDYDYEEEDDEVDKEYRQRVQSVPLTCAPTGADADSDGNDGTCQESSKNELTIPYAKKLQRHLRHVLLVHWRDLDEEDNTDLDILKEYPDPPVPMCSVKAGKLLEKPSSKESKHEHLDLLPGNKCPQGSVCYEDLYGGHDETSIYGYNVGDKYHARIYKRPIRDHPECQFVNGHEPINTCHSSSPQLKLGKCEKIVLERRKNNLSKFFKLNRGSQCNYTTEKFVRDMQTNGKINRYYLLNTVELLESKLGFCDANKLLVCTQENKCDCVPGTAPRKSNDWRQMSDYCYMTSGRCDKDMTSLLPKMTEEEKSKVKSHYAYESAKYNRCEEGNVCAWLKETTKSYESHECYVTTEKEIIEGGGSGGGGGEPGGGIGRPNFYGCAVRIQDQKIILGLLMLIFHIF